MPSIFIKNAFVVTMDKQRRIFRRGTVHIEEGKIVSVEKEAGRSARSAEFVIDAENKVVMPGFVDTHAHLTSVFLRGVYSVIPTFPYGLYQIMFPIMEYVKPEDMYLFGLASCAEAINGGATTVVHTWKYLKDFARAADETGIRTMLGELISETDYGKLRGGVYEYLPEQSSASFRRTTELVSNWHGRAGGRITCVLAPHAPDFTTPESYVRCGELAKERNLRITTHLSQSWNEELQVKKRYGKTSVQHLGEMGLLDGRLSAAHCKYLTEGDTMLMRESGAAILHCPRIYATYGGTTPLVKWLDMGIPVGLGTDDVLHSMSETLRAGLYAARIRAQGIWGVDRMLADERPSLMELLELATIRGAEAVGIDGEVGSLEPGKKADLIAFDMLSPHLTPTIEPLSSVFLYGTSSDIDTVIVDGKIVKDNGTIKGLDLNGVLGRAQRRTEEIWDKFLKDNADIMAVWKEYMPRVT